MTADPDPRSERAERAELARLLPSAAAPELSPRRHLLLKEHLMDTVHEQRTRTPHRRRLVLKIALPAVVAAGAAAVALVPNAGPASTPAIAKAPTQAQLGTISNVGYTLESKADRLTLTMFDEQKGVDPDQLQRDLDRAGVPARVYPGEFGCKEKEPDVPDRDTSALTGDFLTDNGWTIETQGTKSVLTVLRGRIPAGQELFIYLPEIKTTPAHKLGESHTGLMKAPGPSCLPAKVFFNPLASLYPTPPKH
ncbi:hypothetical protein CFP65_1539 [Kitasatospora sp. MMS16-BH015]|uniref:hypothetical protein n=1 Tax=Kitasatospora sp. MMS16-BH015 TaxID=2018025 RepID=UPI000CA2762E|nr:hypothetical protein [Kitasatospora sp. MMS16-BH015]AUG76429.1 hypothetical protein CFP65_1539 [Kitasatospora sp. MMS16-BH015]